MLVALVATAAFTWLYLLSHDLFVWTEARSAIFYHHEGDIARFLLFPEPNFAVGRLAGIASFQLTGRFCGVDTGCVNAVGAGMTTLGVILLLAHTRQLTRSAAIAVCVALLWILSAPVLGITIWQAARYDMLAFIGAMAAGVLWWDAFGRPHLSPVRMVLTVVGSILVMAFAFNAKELTFYLVGLMPLLAVVRGIGIAGGVTRNLAMTAVPVAYGVFFIAHALTHIVPAYAAVVGGSDLGSTLLQLISQGTGLHGNFLFLWQQNGPFQPLNAAARTGVLGAAALAILALVWAIAHGTARRIVVTVRRRRWASLARRSGLWVYLGATMLGVLVISARSRGAAAYYLPIAYWAGLILGFILLRWLRPYLPARPWGLAALALSFVLPALLAYASLVGAGTTYARLAAASDRMDEAGTILRETLADRDVAHVRWRMLDLADTAFFVTRGDPVTFQPTLEIWPWLVRDPSAQPQVTAVTAGSLDDMRESAAAHDAPGEVVLVMSADYHVLLIAHEGRILWDPEGMRDTLPTVARRTLAG